jgi:hypothetical protein
VGSIALQEVIMPKTIIVRTPVGNGWSIVKVIKLPPSTDEAA